MSNFYPAPFVLRERKWVTVEHYYQAHKYDEGTPLFELMASAPTARQAKDTARRFTPDDWTVEHKVAVMRRAVHTKFKQNRDLQLQLLLTSSARLVEASTKDSFWGYGSDYQGVNMMGLLLMEIRAVLTK